MKLTDISNNKAKEIIEGAPKEATHFSCIEGKTQYYKNETVISSLDEVFINVFRDIFQPSVFLLSDLENQMNIDKVETQTEHQEEMSAFSGKITHKVIVEHIKWNFECAWHAIKAFEDGEKLYTKQSDSEFLLIDNAPDVLRYLYSIYERIERDETPQQREDRERLEAAYELCCTYGNNDFETANDFKQFHPTLCDKWLAIVDKTNYRKGGER